MKTINLIRFAGTFAAYQNCIKTNNTEWKEKHEDILNDWLESLPSGSGIDAGIKFDFENSLPDKLIFTFGFHHMNDGGYYDGWTEHKLILTPSFIYDGIQMRITGKDRNMIKEYLSDLFSTVFTVDSNAALVS